MPVPPVIDIPVEIQAPFESSQSFDSSQLAIPLVFEGSVESFDPVARAADLATTLPRQWCGSYTSFASNSTVDVELTLTRLKPMGQMVDLRGEMRIGTIFTPVQGNLNAKSDQLDLLPLSRELTNEMEIGGRYLGLQGFSLAGWQAPRLTNPGGRLDLSRSCAVSESAPIRALW
jgi:hypothetical protein